MSEPVLSAAKHTSTSTLYRCWRQPGKHKVHSMDFDFSRQDHDPRGWGGCKITLVEMSSYLAILIWFRQFWHFSNHDEIDEVGWGWGFVTARKALCQLFETGISGDFRFQWGGFILKTLSCLILNVNLRIYIWLIIKQWEGGLKIWSFRNDKSKQKHLFGRKSTMTHKSWQET